MAGKPAAPHYSTAPTFTVDTTTDLLHSVGHGLTEGRVIRMATTTTLPAPFAAATSYYVIATGLTADDFKVSATMGGSAIDITTTGTGTHTWSRYISDAAKAIVDAFMVAMNSTGPAFEYPTGISEADIMIADLRAHWATPAYQTWWMDNEISKETLYYLRKVDISQAVDATVPVSADPLGVGSGAATSPVATAPSPTQCEPVQVSYTGILGGTITLEMTCPTPGSTIHYRRPSGSGSWNIYGGPVGMIAAQQAEFYASAPGLTDSATDTFDNS
jgi:hypothetical protein